MSFEESLLRQIMSAVQQVQLDVVVIGNAAAALHGVPITTQDVDLFLRDTPRNAEKIRQLTAALGEKVVASRPFEPTSRMVRIEGLPIDIDLVFELSSHARFESVRSRGTVVTIEGVPVRIADLRDVIDAKRAAGRPKDLATLPLLEDFLRIKEAMSKQE